MTDKNMSARVGKQSLKFRNPPYIIGRSAIVGPKEKCGPLGKYFKNTLDDDKWDCKTFELAEQKMLESVVRDALKSAKIEQPNIFFSGDLVNQITSSSYTARQINASYIGVYGACSTMAASIIMGACFIDGGFAESAACATGSHFSTAERQYRTPLEHGAQRTPYAQWTVTGAGCTLLGSAGSGVRVTGATIGRVIDYGIKDIANMGAAMAPAALETIATHLKENSLTVDDYDLIVTGDLGKYGSDVLRMIAVEEEINLKRNYKDCGAMIYNIEQRPYQGGSGCGCGASVLNSFLLDKMEDGEYKKILFVATGALMSLVSSQQGETIPCIAHAIALEA